MAYACSVTCLPPSKISVISCTTRTGAEKILELASNNRLS